MFLIQVAGIKVYVFVDLPHTARTRAAGRIDHMSDGDDTALATGDVDLATMSTPAATSAPTDSRKTKFNSQDVPAPDLTLKE